MLVAVALVSGCRSVRVGATHMHGAPMTLVGHAVEVGDRAPDFRAVDRDYKPVRLSDFAGRPVLISSAPSLDTEVCALQAKMFNEAIRNIGGDVVTLVITMDLPFAQRRFCESEGVDVARVLSDVLDRDFGRRYGLLIKERGLLARAVLVIDRDGRIVYQQIVPELTTHPDYDAALTALRRLVGS